jgi:hypothetical protein
MPPFYRTTTMLRVLGTFVFLILGEALGLHLLVQRWSHLVRTADVRLILSRPLEARGLFGRTRRFQRLLLTVDRPDELIAVLQARP